VRFDAETLGLPRGASALLRDLIHERTGLYYPDERCDQMLERLAGLVIGRGFASYLDYYYLLKYDEAGASEWGRVMDVLSTPETYFWREVDQIRALVDHVVPAFAASHQGETLRIWSVPCASGEEPLSIAMALHQACWFERLPIVIEASDASPAAIARAHAGSYRERSFRNLPPHLREQYFTPNGAGWRISPELHARIRWSVANLTVDDDIRAHGGASVVFCRNLFIYFSERAIQRVVGMLARSMPSGGWLFVGVSESLLKITSEFELAEIGGAFVYVKR
jgi:chemotaxis protein methyltransferase CheR